MANKHGDFIWYELLANDANTAQDFYGDLLSWQFTDSGQTDRDYRIFQAQDAVTGEQYPIGGFIQLTEDMKKNGARPLWLSYINVEDVDACITRIETAGGKTLMPANDLPGIGRIALITDPQGVPTYIMKGNTEMPPSIAFAHDKPRPGHCAWNELLTTDPTKAFAFYSNEFAWEKEGEMDMGELGAYEFIRHGSMIGAIMKKPEALPMPMWNFYFRVENIDTAIEKVTANGGQIIQGPQEVPGGDFVFNGLDPQGAPFSIVGTR